MRWGSRQVGAQHAAPLRQFWRNSVRLGKIAEPASILSGMRRGRPPYPGLLTPREQQVLDLIRQGLTNEQIAQRLGISFSGARYHAAEILSKLGVNSRQEAALWSPRPLPTGARRFGVFGVLFGRIAGSVLARAAGSLAIAASVVALLALLLGVIEMNSREALSGAEVELQATAESDMKTPETTNRLIPDARPARPIVLEPVPPDSPLRSPIIYDTQAQATLEPGTAAYRRGWSAIDPFPAVAIREGRIAVFDHGNGQWWAVKDIDRATIGPLSNGGSRLAVLARGYLTVLDFAASTWQEYPVDARPVAWSPDDQRLVVTVRSSDPMQSPHIVFPIANPAAAARLPLGKSPNSLAQNLPVWINNTHLLMVSQKVRLLQIVDVGAAPLRLVLEEAVPTNQVALSRDRSLLAVQERSLPSGGVAIYRLEPFSLLGTLDGASLGYQLEVPSEIWSGDSGQLLAQQGPCGDSQRLMLFDLAATIQKEIAVGRVMRFVLSPDSEWVAYTSFAGLPLSYPQIVQPRRSSSPTMSRLRSHLAGRRIRATLRLPHTLAAMAIASDTSGSTAGESCGLGLLTDRASHIS
jgi:DNA-binding CsgD family transcriptional regulator